MKKLIAIIIFSMGFAFSFGEEIDMNQAIEKALTNSYDVQKSKKEIEIKEIERTKAYKQIYPKITFSTGYTKLSDTIHFGAFNIKESDYSYTNKLTLQQPLYMGGAIFAAMRTIDIGRDIVSYQAEQKKREVRIDVIQNYIAIVKLMKTKTILESSLNELNETNKKLEESYKLELIQKKPLLDIRFRISDIKTNIISVEKEIEIRTLKLKNIMRVDAETRINIKEIEVPEIDIKKIEISKDISYAKENKIIMKIINATKKISLENEKIKFADLMPKVAFRCNYEIKGFETGGDSSGTWNANISANINVFDFGSTMDEYNKSKRETSKREIEESSAGDGVEIAIKSAYIDMERLTNIIGSKVEALESAKENYRIEKRKSELDMNTLTELLSAENDLRKIETEVVNTKLDLYSAYLRYKDIVEREEVK